MDKRELRRADFITSIIFIVFGIWVIEEALKMPLRESYAGVQNVWYVSPALFPLIIGTFITLFGIMLLANAVRTGGASYFFQTLRRFPLRREKFFTESNVKFVSILLALFTFVYLFIPRVDFFISVSMFLMYFISSFYPGELELLKKFTRFYAVGSLCFTIIFWSGLGEILNSNFRFFTDVLALVFLGAYIFYSLLETRDNFTLRRRVYEAIGVSFLFPLFICPAFRYFLLVPLPKEGLIIEGMHLIYYALK